MNHGIQNGGDVTDRHIEANYSMGAGFSQGKKRRLPRLCKTREYFYYWGMRLKASVVFFLLAGPGLLFPGELDDIMGRYLPAKAKKDLAALTRNLEKLEKDLAAQRAAGSGSPAPASRRNEASSRGTEKAARASEASARASETSARARETTVGVAEAAARAAEASARASEASARIGTLLRENLTRIDARGWQNLRRHLLGRYEREFLPREASEEIEASLPAAARRRILTASYSAISFLKSAETQLPPSTEKGKALVRHRERTLRLQSFAAETPAFLRLTESGGTGGLGPEERKSIGRLLSAGRVFSSRDWDLLASGDPLCRTLIDDRFRGFGGGGTVGAMNTADALGLSLGDYVRGTDMLYLVSVNRWGQAGGAVSPEPAPAEIPADPAFRKNLAEGREIADRVLEVLLRDGADVRSGSRLTVLELLNHRIAGLTFLTSEKYRPVREAFFSFLDALYREVDAKAAMLLGSGGGGGTGTGAGGPGGGGGSAAVRDVFPDILRRLGSVVRLVCLYREETSPSGFPNPVAVDPEEARSAYARAFWAVTQGAESDGSPETAEEWAQAHGQITISLPLFLGLKSGGDALGLYLSSYPDGVLRDYPDYAAVFDSLAREAAFPWFRWSFRITYPLLKAEYRARGFEALLAAYRVVDSVYGLGLNPGGEGGRILAGLESLARLRIPEEELQSKLVGKEALPEAVDRIIAALGDTLRSAQGEFLRASRKEVYDQRSAIAGLSAHSGDFPGAAAALLRRVNDALGERSLSGEEYLETRALLFKRAADLFRERGEESAGRLWLDSLAASGIISERERSERSPK